MAYAKIFDKGGICSPLCIVFLRLQATGEVRFNTYVTSRDGREDVMNLKSQQHGSSHLHFAASYLKLFGLTHACTRLNEQSNIIWNLLKISGYYVLRITDLSVTYSNVGDSRDCPARC